MDIIRALVRLACGLLGFIANTDSGLGQGLMVVPEPFKLYILHFGFSLFFNNFNPIHRMNSLEG